VNRQEDKQCLRHGPSSRAGLIPKLTPHPQLVGQFVRRPNETDVQQTVTILVPVNRSGALRLNKTLLPNACLAQPSLPQRSFVWEERARWLQESPPMGTSSSSTAGLSQPAPYLPVHVFSPSDIQFSLILT